AGAPAFAAYEIPAAQIPIDTVVATGTQVHGRRSGVLPIRIEVAVVGAGLIAGYGLRGCARYSSEQQHGRRYEQKSRFLHLHRGPLFQSERSIPADPAAVRSVVASLRPPPSERNALD